MPATEIAAHNERLAAPPEFDLSNSDQLGLFVAAALAARHQIRITLRRSPLGGTTAIVLLPPAIMVPAQDAVWALDAPDTGGSPSGPVSNLMSDHGRAGVGDAAPVFGMNGRHRPTPESSPARSLPSSPPALEAAASAASGWFSGDQVRSGNVAGDAGRSGAQFTDTWLDDPTGGGAEFSDATADGSHLGLPRRVRQAGSAPQLRSKFSSAPEVPGRDPSRSSPGAVTGRPAERSPEEAGSMLSALQAGWEQARIQDLD
jgi:hypothetical protein